MDWIEVMIADDILVSSEAAFRSEKCEDKRNGDEALDDISKPVTLSHLSSGRGEDGS